MTEIVITPTGRTRLDAELERLATEGRREIAERLKHAAAGETNRAENAEYLGVREDQALLERRIAMLEERIAFAQLVEPDASNGIVDVGERVRLRDLDTGEKVEVELVGSFEGDPFEGRISVASPLGEALLGRRRGEVAIVDAPGGRLRFEVLAVDP